MLKLKSEQGLPIAIDEQPLSLAQIILRLNEIGGEYGVGRYNGLEDTPLGIKNHEIREAPGATAILAAHASLERANLTQREIRIKNSADLEWVELVTNGFWHTPLCKALGMLISSLSQLITGEITLEFSPGNVFVAAIKSSQAIHFQNVDETITPLIEEFSYRQHFEISALPFKLRPGFHSLPGHV